MNLKQSDLSERLPLFEEYKGAIGDTASRAYDHIDPTVISMMTNCVPVGLRTDNSLAIPKSYEPEDGPPVLMLRPGENVDIRWSDGMEKALQYILRLANIAGPSNLDLGTAPTSDGHAYLQSTVVPLFHFKDPESVVEPLNIPRCVILRPQGAPTDRSNILLHECDHWDFYLNSAPSFSLPDASVLPAQGKSALAEKRAFKTNYTKLANTGLTGYFMTAEHLAHYLSGYNPADAAGIALTMLKRFHLPQNHISTVATALSLRFADADPSIEINEHEVEAYRAAGLVTK